MKHILTLLTLCVIACLGQPVRAAQENHVVSIRADFTQTIGTANPLAPSCCVITNGAIEGRVRAPDDPVGIVMLDQTVVCPKCIGFIGAPVANGTTFNWQTRALDNPTIEVVPGRLGLAAAWSSPAPYDPVNIDTSLVTVKGA